MFYYYKYKNNFMFSYNKKYPFNQTTLDEISKSENCIYYLNELNLNISKKTFSISDSSMLFIEKEDIEFLNLNLQEHINIDIPEKIQYLIDNNKVKCINTKYPNFEDSILLNNIPKMKKLNIFALGDVGSTLLTGLRLLGGSCISSLGIYDRSPNKIKRFEFEMNQTMFPFDYNLLPEVKGISKNELFDCDMFVFCASKGVPEVGSNVKDVRMIQLEENKKIIKEYARMARHKNFKGIFAVVSDPVDQLCQYVLHESNINEKDIYDFNGLSPEQIKGYGLGVMNSRAAFFAKRNIRYKQFLQEGRAFGPHGKDLIIADSILNYNDTISKELTTLTVNANLDVRSTGYKPYIAPALSSGSISIILTLQGKWHYSSNFLSGVYMGTKNRNTSSGVEFERLHLPKDLFERIEHTYKKLKKAE